MTSALVSTEWLAAHLDDPLVRPVDGSFYLPAHKRDADAEYLAGHIPGAARFDVDKIADHATDLPHMLPSPESFAKTVSALGLGSDCHIVAYDGFGLLSAARVWWMFRVFGHDRVSVLDGGMPKWLAEGRPTESGPAQPAPRSFKPSFRADLVRSADQVATIIRIGGTQIVDARSAARFEGTEAEPRAGLRSGHIPGSRSVPSGSILAPDKTMLPPAELEKLFREAGIDPGQPIITTCGSGVTACMLALALNETGHPDVPVYDGSWSEWGAREELPVATGKA